MKRGIYTLNKPLERIKEAVFPFFPPSLTSLPSTLLLSEQEDLTLIITIALLLVATLKMTAVKSFMRVQNYPSS